MDHLTSFHHMNSAMTVICAHCRQAFSLDALDMAFYHDIAPSFGGRRTSIPAPTHCPDCRCQRRLAWRNEKSLYRRQCSFSGKPILSIYAPEKPFAVYDAEVWMSDAWDPMHYGRSIDWQRSFFDQWQDLHQVVPLPSFNMRFQNENSDYTNLSSYTAIIRQSIAFSSSMRSRATNASIATGARSSPMRSTAAIAAIPIFFGIARGVIIVLGARIS
jgi:hypothetical protein